MYSYTISDEETKKIAKKTQDYANLMENFNNIDKKYTPDFSNISLQRKNFERPGDEQIENSAKKSLQEYKQTESENIEKTYKDKNDNIDAKMQEAENDRNNQITQTKQKYDELKNSASKDALKRGLARSSIVINIMDAFDKGMIDEVNKINNDIKKTVESLINQKELLAEQKQNALNSFDLTYALKLSDKIDQINKNLDEQEQKILEYNNQIAQKESEYQAKMQQNMLNYAKNVNQNSNEAIENLKREQKYAVARDYLMGLTKNEAIEELETNKTFNSELGPTFFNRLKILINARKD